MEDFSEATQEEFIELTNNSFAQSDIRCALSTTLPDTEQPVAKKQEDLSH